MGKYSNATIKCILEEIASFDVERALEEAKENSKKYSGLSCEPGSINYPYVTGCLTAHLQMLVTKAKIVLK